MHPCRRTFPDATAYTAHGIDRACLQPLQAMDTMLQYDSRTVTPGPAPLIVMSHSMPRTCRDRQIEDRRVAASAAREAKLEADRRMEATRAVEVHSAALFAHLHIHCSAHTCGVAWQAEAARAARASRRQHSDFLQHQIEHKAELAAKHARQAKQVLPRPA